MKIYMVNIKFAYCEYYDIDKAEAYLSREKAVARINELCIGGYGDGEDLDDVYIQEYEVRDAE